MARSPVDPNVQAHLDWIGFVKPTGLVVSAQALVRAGAILSQRDREGQQRLRECVAGPTKLAGAVHEQAAEPYGRRAPDPNARVAEFPTLARNVLNWSFSPKYYAGTADSPIPEALSVQLPEYRETLRPDYAVREPEPKENAPAWQLVVKVVPDGADFEQIERGPGGLEASPLGRMERFLRQSGVASGLLFNGRALRLVSAPKGESSGWLDFRISDMVQPTGRPISTAMRLLLDEHRLLAAPRPARLAALLEDSRRYQNTVSERLAEQVLHALYELLRGVQAAHDRSDSRLLHPIATDRPDDVYRALLTVVLRLVFLLYTEERNLLPSDGTFLKYYSLAGLFEQLRDDAARYPDTMDQRYGAWARLLVLFRLVHDGADTDGMRLPARHGLLFDPDRFPFLEGRQGPRGTGAGARVEPPLIPDGTIYRALEKLLVLDGERISYRALDVEQIGSVYETMMGFRLETATGRSLAVRADKAHGAPTTINLDALLATSPAEREKWISDRCARKFTDTVRKGVRSATSIEALHAALHGVSDLRATPDLVPVGAMILQPSEERRRSGSHYTPRSLTEPIVRTTLAPLLDRLRGQHGAVPTPAQILDLKVCDPAMGSGAFLVEGCRQLGDVLVEAWRAHAGRPPIPPDEDEIVHARRLIAQRCLYGVDKNPVAVDLAKVSLWLTTLAKDHPLTFVNHALRHGDSLVGLSRSQIESLHWENGHSSILTGFGVRESIEEAETLRRQIRDAGDEVSDAARQELWERSGVALASVRLFGDLTIAAFFAGEKPKDREAQRGECVSEIVAKRAEQHRARIAVLRKGERALVPFHWDVEFPEVFDRENPGFDAFVGNPPFCGGRKISGSFGGPYLAWLTSTTERAGGQADFVTYFFRRSFERLRNSGTFGLIGTKSISEGDSRPAALGYITENGGQIYAAVRRFTWVGQAAVVVSVIHVSKNSPQKDCILDGKRVPRITAYLVDRGPNGEPARLSESLQLAHKGKEPYGRGFQFSDLIDGASPLSEMRRILRANPVASRVVAPYLGGDEILESPTHQATQYVIDFGNMSENEARGYPELFQICFERVRPERARKAADVAAWPFWRFWRHRPGMMDAIRGMTRFLAHPFTSTHLAFVFVPASTVVASPHVVVAIDTYSGFCVLQSRVHEVWARFFGSSLGGTFRYTPSDCFHTFPLPGAWLENATVEAAGLAYYELREGLLVRANQGLTQMYNRFHERDERDPEVVRLRELHANMDRAVLDAYGWGDILTECEFLLDHEIDEEEWGDKKKPYHYRWPDEVRDEVLARLLELNVKRAAAEAHSYGSTGATPDRGRKRRRGTSGSDGGLFDDDE